MNHNLVHIKGIFLFSIFIWNLGLFSCSILGFPSGQNWSAGAGRNYGIVELGTVRVDKNADWDSVEAETRRLLPLFLSEAGYKPGSTETALLEQKPAYTIDAILIEREYMENWKTRRSLSVEIFIWKNEKVVNSSEIPKTAGDKMPLAAGKALLSGSKSLSSSRVLHNLLKLALSNALKAMP